MYIMFLLCDFEYLIVAHQATDIRESDRASNLTLTMTALKKGTYSADQRQEVSQDSLVNMSEKIHPYKSHAYPSRSGEVKSLDR
jgi:hypothetical protein